MGSRLDDVRFGWSGNLVSRDESNSRDICTFTAIGWKKAGNQKFALYERHFSLES